MTEHFPEATKAIWQFEGQQASTWTVESHMFSQSIAERRCLHAGIYCSSRHIPGVRFAGLIHPGLIGTAPSKELLDMWNERERKLVSDGPEALTLGGCLHTRPLGRIHPPRSPVP